MASVSAMTAVTCQKGWKTAAMIHQYTNYYKLHCGEFKLQQTCLSKEFCLDWTDFVSIHAGLSSVGG